MGITRESLKIYEVMNESGAIKFNDPLMVFELGAQTIHFDNNHVYKSFLEKIDSSADMSSLIYNSESKSFHEKLGHTYHCADLDPLVISAMRWDLNSVKCPTDLQSTFNLVTNHGTTEHLLGQVNAFELMHDLTMVGGCMVHSLPCVEPNHGFFSYSPVLFESMSISNSYKIICFYLSPLMSQYGDIKLTPYQSMPACMNQYHACYLHVVLQKTAMNRFKMPTQIFNQGVK